MGIIARIVLGLGAGLLANLLIPEPALQPGGRRAGRPAASRLSPLAASGDRIR
jgi:hypothetical protein